ncbi:MAG: Ribose ABC transport system, permease protein RbsC, partial [uncultured Thermomicrobiales bacterium]
DEVGSREPEAGSTTSDHSRLPASGFRLRRAEPRRARPLCPDRGAAADRGTADAGIRGAGESADAVGAGVVSGDHRRRGNAGHPDRRDRPLGGLEPQPVGDPADAARGGRRRGSDRLGGGGGARQRDAGRVDQRDRGGVSTDPVAGNDARDERGAGRGDAGLHQRLTARRGAGVRQEPCRRPDRRRGAVGADLLGHSQPDLNLRPPAQRVRAALVRRRQQPARGVSFRRPGARGAGGVVRALRPVRRHRGGLADRLLLPELPRHGLALRAAGDRGGGHRRHLDPRRFRRLRWHHRRRDHGRPAPERAPGDRGADGGPTNPLRADHLADAVRLRPRAPDPGV